MNDTHQPSHAERGRMGAVKRWRGRGPSVTIRVDEAAAAALEAIPQGERRAFASEAIISAVAASKKATK